MPARIGKRQPGGQTGIGLGRPRWPPRFLIYFGSEHWDSRGPRPPPGWRSAVWALVAEIIAGASSCK